ncbi:MAG TPA: hypothetical protein VLH94_01100 [Spirochaetia bacterium]|nr:hypothetical protein [Spirochaetia bacterium]
MIFSTETGSLSPREIEKMVDALPEYDFSGVNYFELKQNRGAIPLMSNWFWPRKEDGSSDGNAVNDLKSSTEYRKWEPGKLILERATWKEREHALPYFLDAEAKAMLDEWQEKGEIRNRYDRLHLMGISANIVRLLTHEHAPACHDFALATMEYVSEIDKDDIDRIFPRLEDGNEMAQFWTIAPYIYDSLRTDRVEKGQAENNREDYYRVLLWLSMRIKSRGFGANAKYPGISKYEEQVSAPDLYLPRDGYHPVHQYVEKIGKHIATYLEKIPVNEESIRKATIRVEGR